ncbi:hypothetical protein F5Y18DRAFT_148379 [Xylariaceae sp. FL1019]|nr:hypothetical protein F5Y18DRAFT_148379 [Xylariaceae sp. FL1019]
MLGMLSSVHTAELLTLVLAVLTTLVHGQQFKGDVIPNSLPDIAGAEKAYWKVNDAASGNYSTLITHSSLNSQNERHDPADVKRLIIAVHGLGRDGWLYVTSVLNSLNQLDGTGPNIDNVVVLAPHFANGDDKGTSYPWDDTQPAGGYGSNSTAMVWAGSEWISGSASQYPVNGFKTSSYDILDRIIRWYSLKTRFPNLKTIVIAGHSAGAQLTQRYAAIGHDLTSALDGTRLIYSISNPNSFLWLNSSRPLDTSSCTDYNDWRQGIDNFDVPYNTALLAQGSAAVTENYKRKGIAYGRALRDLGGIDEGCGATVQGSNRHERFLNFIATFTPACPDPTSDDCDTIDYVNTTHNEAAMWAADSGKARLFLDFFDGAGSRSPDFWCSRISASDDPYPNPNCDS